MSLWQWEHIMCRTSGADGKAQGNYTAGVDGLATSPDGSRSLAPLRGCDVIRIRGLAGWKPALQLAQNDSRRGNPGNSGSLGFARDDRLERKAKKSQALGMTRARCAASARCWRHCKVE